MIRGALAPALLLGLIFALVPAAAALADGPADSRSQTVIEGLTPGQGDRSVILSARVADASGQPVRGVPLSFYVVTEVFGERLMKVGQPLTDVAGTAYVVYEHSWQGEHKVVVRFDGDDTHAPAQTGFTFEATGPVELHENARFGLEPVRAWLPVAVGAVLLGVWGTVGLVMVWTVIGIPAAGKPQPAPQFAPFPSPPTFRPARLAPGLALATAAVVLMAAGGWFLLGQQEGEKSLISPGQSGEPGRHLPVAPGDRLTLPVVASINLDGAAEATPRVVSDGHSAFVLAASQILALSPAGDSHTVIADGAQNDWLRGASAIAARNGKLYVASALTGDVIVLDRNGSLERSITPLLPPGGRPLRAAGMAITESGKIWISDAENQRVVLLDADGTLLRSIGQDIELNGGENAVRQPAGLTLDEAGNLYVVDWEGRDVKKLSPLGVFLGSIGGGQGDEAPLLQPQDVAVDSSGTVFVTCEGHQRVHIFAADGTHQGYLTPDGEGTAWPEARIVSPYGVAAAGDRLYVTDGVGVVFGFQLFAPGH